MKYLNLSTNSKLMVKILIFETEVLILNPANSGHTSVNTTPMYKIVKPTVTCK